MKTSSPTPIILRRRAVQERVGLSRSQIYALARTGDFPRPVPLGVRAVGWLSTEIDAWLAARIASRTKD